MKKLVCLILALVMLLAMATCAGAEWKFERKIDLVGAYTTACFLIGALLHRAGCFSRAEAMLAATPAGASDMALISADLGICKAKLIVLQVLRLITVVLVFPSILSVVVGLFG